MENRIGSAATSRTATTQADEALRRVTAQPDETRDVYQQLAARAGRQLLTALADLPEFKPRPGVTLGKLRVTVTVIDGPDLGSVDIDPINVGDLANLTARRAEGLRAKHARTARPALRLLGGGA